MPLAAGHRKAEGPAIDGEANAAGGRDIAIGHAVDEALVLPAKIGDQMILA